MVRLLPVAVAAALLSGCPKLLPPPADIDAYCRNVLAQKRGIPPECVDTADMLARQARGEFTRDEEIENLSKTHPYAACLERAAEDMRRCDLGMAISGIGSGTITAFTGVDRDPDDKARAAARCNDARLIEVEICRARYLNGGQ